ncbi:MULTISPECIES: DnaB-like helicase N-terminal domain-containing protein [unclassified Pseudomonas]|uniref:DnaB-like helicase N-terminal domain-containing protein n=1 Tax=unclassified Pseudomonas TaxID=196821 RepID=UPI000837DC2D|nr:MULTISPECIES: DnaB-like helicase N-terminal domain-containing protein [unclassified Pseudomonas]QIH07391.1 hypothetical protein ATY02_11980 [Pseudomonas sp. BIOMIG1BAC]
MTSSNEDMHMVPMAYLTDEHEAAARKAERDALGLLMLSGDPDGLLDFSPSMFTGKDHHALYRALEALAASYLPMDVVTVSEALDRAGELPLVGGVAGIGHYAVDAPRLTTYALSRVILGYALARYAMVRQANTTKVAVRFREAVENGWAHGRAWLATRDETRRLGLPDARPVRATIGSAMSSGVLATSSRYEAPAVPNGILRSPSLPHRKMGTDDPSILVCCSP